jgi:chemotaxis protein MotB
VGKQASKIIVIRKKVKGHGGHHGGSWKVAYADFVTAMMAFFMVMWILGMDQQLRQAIEGYFSNPVGYKKGYSGGATPISSGSSPASVKTNAIFLASREYQRRKFDQVSNDLRSKLDSLVQIGQLRTKVEVIVSEDGLRIELIESETGDTFFPLGSSEIKPEGRETLQIIATELANLENPIAIEGHTDAAPFTAGARFTNWELSNARANAARRVLETTSISPRRIVEVTGYADRQLRNEQNPRDPANRRISLMLPFVRPPESPQLPSPADPSFPTARPGVGAYPNASDSSRSRVHSSD